MVDQANGVGWLFCPADRPDRFAKAAAAADVVIVDLEDGVAVGDRPAARNAMVATPLDVDRTVIRINPAGTTDHALDLEALRRTNYRRIMLAKTESAAEAERLAPLEVVALCETPRGILQAASIADAAAVVALMWGAEDLVASLGGQSSRDQSGRYRDVARQARSMVLLAAGGAGKLAVDSVYLAIDDHAGLEAEAIDAVQSGFGAKACIHPTHVPHIRAAFRPTVEQHRWARRVLKAAETEPGVFGFEGGMVDEPVLRHARAVLARAAASGPDERERAERERAERAPRSE